MLLSEIPELAKAISDAEQKEDQLREFAFSGLPDQICGMDVEQLRIPHIRLLLLSKNPYLCGGQITPESTMAFLWTVSMQFKQGDSEARNEFVRMVGGLTEDWEAGILDYIHRSLMDAPCGEGGGASIASASASLGHWIASAYGWTRTAIEAEPIAALYQMMRLIQRDANPKTCFVNKISDSIRAKKVKEFFKQ